MFDRVLIDAGARSALSAHVNAEPLRETGGILLGYEVDERTLRVTAVSPPGPRAIKMRYFFRRDTRFLQRWLERRHELSGGRDDYVGEWHVHHALDAPPSCVDRNALWRIARKANYPTSTPVLVIVEDVLNERRLRGYEFTTRPKRRYREISLD
jgi:integrative and conjugative element protein (TIGR02256 family)